MTKLYIISFFTASPYFLLILEPSGIDISSANQKPKELSIEEKVERYRQSLVMDAMHEKDRVVATEAAYKKSLGIAPNTGSAASNTTDGTEKASEAV